MDKTNIKILRILQKKARIPNVEVSRMIDLAPSAVLERIRKMEKQGIIDGYEVRLNPKRFGRSQVSFMHIQVLPKGDYHQIAQELSEYPEIQEVHYIAGEDSFLIKIRTADTDELNTLLHNSIKSIDGVGTTRTLPVLATHKETAQIPID